MTAHAAKAKKRIFGIGWRRIKRVPFFALAVLFFTLFFLRNSELAKAAVLAGLRRAALGVLPSVFPFLVLSGLLVSANGLPRATCGWLSPIFRLPPAACAAILSGWLCGFPIGAVYASKEAERGNLPIEEGARAVAAASVPSPAFAIGVVGVGVFGSAGIGGMIWLFCALSAAIVCAASGRNKKKRGRPPQKPIPSQAEPFFKALTSAVANAGAVSLNLCAFVTFFAVLIAAIQAIFDRFGAPVACGAPVAALLELSGGIFSASSIPVAFRLPFCSAACGWAGFSVHFQIFSVCETMRLQHRKYLFAKVLQALLCFAFAFLWQLIR